MKNSVTSGVPEGNESIELSQDERVLLAESEQMISSHIRAFFEVGMALSRIRDLRLYRAEFSSFEQYCRERWDISRAHAYRLLSAAEFRNRMSPRGDIPLPENERQVRLLARLTIQQARNAWKRAVQRAGHPEKVSASLVKSIVREYGGVNPDPLLDVPQWRRDVEELLQRATKALGADKVLDAIHDIELARVRLEIEAMKSARSSFDAENAN